VAATAAIAAAAASPSPPQQHGAGAAAQAFMLQVTAKDLSATRQVPTHMCNMRTFTYLGTYIRVAWAEALFCGRPATVTAWHGHRAG
jgi:hypothetical protein